MDIVTFGTITAAGLSALYLRKNRPVPRPFKTIPEEERVFVDPNSPRDAEGHVHHLHVKDGEVANRILSVGDMGRADRIARLLDDYGIASAGAPLHIVAPRGFVTYTGTYKGVPVTILATGMGVPMMDFAVRESRSCVPGPMAMLRYGTCGGLRDVKAGTVVVAEGTVLVRREPDLVARKLAALEAAEAAGGAGAMPEDVANIFPYSVSSVVKPNEALFQLLRKNLEKEIHEHYGLEVVTGINASADSFYSSQGRVSSNFHDFNSDLIDRLEHMSGLENLKCLEMETHHLLDLARCSTSTAKIYAAGAAMVIANRHTNEALGKHTLGDLEELGGRAALEALIAFKFPTA